MGIKELITILKQEFSKTLPGFDSQKKLAPESRHNLRDLSQAVNPKKSAVLILLFPVNGEVYVPFIKRVTDGSMHSGQIAFPGGKLENYDNNLTETALREAEEEIGIDKESVEVIRKLTPLYIPVSNFYVQPVVGFIETKPNFIIDKNEVDELYNVSLNELNKAEIINKRFKVRNVEIKAPFFVLNEIEIWGATAMILKEFIDIIKNIYKN